MKVTQKEFVKALTENVTIFGGVVRFFDENRIKAAVHEWIEKVERDNLIVEKRTCRGHRDYLEFTGGSRLYLACRGLHKLDCGNCTVYVCVESWIDEFDYKDYTKSMIYVIDKPKTHDFYEFNDGTHEGMYR